MAKHRLNSLSQNSHQGISNTWEKHTEDTVCEKNFPSAKNFHQGEVSSKGLLDSLAICSRGRLEGGSQDGGKKGAWGNTTNLQCETARTGHQAKVGTREGKGMKDSQRRPAGMLALWRGNLAIPLLGIYPQMYLHMWTRIYGQGYSLQQRVENTLKVHQPGINGLSVGNRNLSLRP